MTVVEWGAVLSLVGGAVDLAIRVVQAIRDGGGCVEGCPVEVERLMPADIPRTGEAVVDAMEKLRRKAIGLDRESIRARLRRPTQSAFGDVRGIDDGDTEHPDAAEVYGPGDYDG